MAIIAGMIYSFFANILGIMFFGTFFRTRFQRKEIQLLFFLVATISSIICSNMLIYHTGIKIGLNTVILSVGMFFIFEVTPFLSLIFSIIYYSVVAVIEVLSLELVYIILPKENLQLINDFSLTLLGMICQIVDFILILIIRKYLPNYPGIKIRTHEWLIFSIFPVFTIVTLVHTISKYGLIRNADTDSFPVYIALGLIAMNFVMYYLMCEISRNDNLITHTKVMKANGLGELNLYEKLTANYELLQKRAHEYSNELAVIQSLAENNDIDKIKTYIAELSHNTIDYQKRIETNNPIADAIINAKYIEALQNNITFVIRINDLSGILLADEDLAVLLSNLLNNAIEAAVQTTQKIVRFKCELSDDNIIVSTSNSSQVPPIVNNGHYVSTKTDTSRPHGFGSRNIKDVIAKYSGDYMEDYADGFFSFTAVIQNHQVAGTKM